MGQFEEDTAKANKLFVEAVKLVKSVANVEGLEEKADALDEALSKLNKLLMTIYLAIWRSS